MFKCLKMCIIFSALNYAHNTQSNQSTSEHFAKVQFNLNSATIQ